MKNKYFISYLPSKNGYINEVKCSIVDSDMNMEEFIIKFIEGYNVVINCIKLN